MAKQRASPRLTAASWQHAHHNGRETFLLHLHSPGAAAAVTAAALLLERGGERQREEGGREGVRSTPLLCCDHTSPAGERVSSSHITQEALLLGAPSPHSLLNVSEEWGRRRFGVELVPLFPQYKALLMLFPCSASLIGTVWLPQPLFSKGDDTSRGLYHEIYTTCR